MQFNISLAVAAALLVAAGTAAAQPQDLAQQRCIVEMNEAAAAVANAQARSGVSCVVSAVRDRLAVGQSAQSCLSADVRGKVNKARARLAQAQTTYCASLPSFGFDDAATVGLAVVQEGVGTYARLFGDTLDDAIVSAFADGSRARCQTAAVKTLSKLDRFHWRAFLACKTSGLRGLDITGAAGLEECLESVEQDALRFVGKMSVKLADGMESVCPDLNQAAAFPGRCAAAADFVDCLRQVSLCGVCLAANRSDDLQAYCDQIDDGVPNASCVDTRRCGNGAVEPGEACDDGNVVSGDCCSSTCTSEAQGAPCASDSNPCTHDRCNAAGVCVHPANSAACNDGTFCNGTDTCAGGTCSVHAGDPCAAGAECNDSCSSAGHCRTAAGTPCTDDGSECTTDACDGDGACGHTPLPAGTECTGDGNACTSDACDETGACAHPTLAPGTPCQDDGNPCTADECDLTGNCVHVPLPSGSTCGDAQVSSCTAADTCDGAGNCLAHDAAAGTACDDDSNVCTDDVCNGSGQCVHSANTLPCTDGLFCNGPDTCSGGSCSVHAGDPCPGADGDANCAESCNWQAQNCTAPDPIGSACTDGLFCNGLDTCSGGSCSVHAGDPCPGADGDANCAESCDWEAQNCTAPDSNGSGCNDGLVCNGSDTCSGGTCSVHSGNPCAGVDGDNNCSETCSEALGGCGADPDGSTCNDGIFCNGADTCDDGFCQNHTGDPCIGPDGDGDCSEQCDEPTDTCNAPDPDGAECNDGQGCNGLDNCAAGVCTGAGTCCGTVTFTFNMTSSNGGAFTAAAWPGGTDSQTSAANCSVTIRRPSGRLDTTGLSGDNFGVTGFSGFANCVGSGGEDGDGCQPLSCPPAGIGQCSNTRPSCSAALNGSGSARYTVLCTDP